MNIFHINNWRIFKNILGGFLTLLLIHLQTATQNNLLMCIEELLDRTFVLVVKRTIVKNDNLLNRFPASQANIQNVVFLTRTYFQQF